MHILAWASALPSDFIRAMREASDGRTVIDTDSYAFTIFKRFLWSLNQGSNSMKGVLFFLIVVAINFTAFAKGEKAEDKVSRYLTEADELYETWITYDSEEFAKSIETYNKLQKHLSKRPKGLDEDKFKGRISDRIQSALKANDARLAIKNIGQYQVFFPDDKRNGEYLEIEALCYYQKRDPMMMERSIAKLEKVLPSGNQKSQDVLESLREKQLEIYAEESFADELQGVWVSDTINEKTGIPVFIFRIYDNGIVEMLDQSEIYSGRLNNLHKGQDVSDSNPDLKKPSLSPVRFAIGTDYDEDNETFIASFESKRFHQGEKDFADAAYNSAQKTLSTTASVVSYGSASTATALSTSIIGLVASGALIIWGNDLAASKRWDTSINVRFERSDKDEMKGVVEIFERYAKSTSSETEETKEAFKTKFYRVSAADNVLFADEKGNLFPLYCYNPYVQDEIALYDYGEIVKNTKLKRKKGFLVPLYVLYFPAAIVTDVTTRKSQKNRCITHNMQMMERVRVNNLQRRNNYYKYNLNI